MNNPYSIHYLEKQAKPKAVGSLLGKVWGGVKKFNDMSVWNYAKDFGSKGTTGLHRTVGNAGKVMTSTPAKALGYYGMAGMALPSLPGSELAMNIGMPGWAALQAATSGIRGYRMKDPKMQERLKADTQSGAQQAGAQFMNTAAEAPNSIDSGNAYINTLGQAGVDTGNISKFQKKEFKPLSTWDTVGSALTNPQGIIDSKTRLAAQEALYKSSSIEKEAVAKGIGKVVGGAMGLMGVGMAGNAAYDAYDSVAGSPYNRESAAQTGYDAAQAGIANRLDKMPGWQKAFVKMDPTLLAQEVEHKIPGSINAWEQGTGAQFRPGLLGSLTSPTKPKYINAEGREIS